MSLPIGLAPQLLRDVDRIDAHVVPPGGLVAAVVELAMMGATERDGELVADLAAHGAWLGEADMVRVRRSDAAQQARLGRDVAQMLLVANAVGLWERERALFDASAKRRLVDGGGASMVSGSGWAGADFVAGDGG